MLRKECVQINVQLQRQRDQLNRLRDRLRAVQVLVLDLLQQEMPLRLLLPLVVTSKWQMQMCRLL